MCKLIVYKKDIPHSTITLLGIVLFSQNAHLCTSISTLTVLVFVG